jgi:hypothetical protein
VSDADIDEAQAGVDEQAKWGGTHESRAIARLIRWAIRAEARIADLRQRVKALEDRFPPP